jgi:hypothetical protein
VDPPWEDARVTVQVPEVAVRTTNTDTSPGAGTYVYGVQAVNTYGTASAVTESLPVTVG